jgi:uncharacterized repeat protein (TIGR02543 family)
MMFTKNKSELKRFMVTLLVVVMVAGVFPVQMAFADAVSVTGTGLGDLKLGQEQKITFSVEGSATLDPNAKVIINYMGPTGAVLSDAYVISPENARNIFDYKDGSSLTITHTPDETGHYNMTIIICDQGGGNDYLYGSYSFDVESAIETITFDANGGTSSEEDRPDIDVIANPIFLTLPNAWRTNHTFLGWFTDKDGGIQVNVGDPVASNLEYKYYAHWNIDRYTVFFESMGGTSVAPRVRDYNTEIGELPTPERAGYTFEGWYDNLGYIGTRITDAYKVTNSTTLFAKWVADDRYEFTVTYVDRASVLRTEAYVEGETVPVFAGNLDRAGYTLVGWEDDKGNRYPRGGAFNMTGTTTLTAKWEPVRYDIYYELDGGTNSRINPRYFTIESPAITLANPRRTGYTFSGWFRDEAFTNPVYSPAIAQGSMGEQTFYAKWTDDNMQAAGGNGSDVLVNAKTAVKSVNTAVKTIYVPKGKTVTIPYVVYANAGFSGKATATWSVNKSRYLSVNSANPTTKKGNITTGKLGAKSVIKVKGKKTGTLTLTIKIGTKTLKCKIVVVKSQKAVKRFVTTKVTKLKVGTSKLIRATKITKKATGNVATFTIARQYKSYLTVDAAGKLTALKVYKNGKKAIPVKVKVGKITKIIKVKVTKK